MQKRDLQRRMYELAGPSTAQRITLAVTGAAWVGLVWWLLVGGGIDAAHAWFGWASAPGDAIRRFSLAAALSIYYVRLLFTEFVFLKRGIAWSEVLTIAPFQLVIFLLLAITAGTNPNALGPAGALGVALFILGSWLHSYAESRRYAWKRRPENRGKLYTEGLFRYSRHPNYLGDLILFSGMCLIAGSWITALIPLLMLTGFVFINIPVLDAHLRNHYGSAFDAYARRTSKLVPFLY